MKPPGTVNQLIVGSLLKSVSLGQALLEDRKLIETVAEVAERMTGALGGGHKPLFFGNGGSAAHAQHMAAELVGRFRRERRALPAIALAANMSTLTSIGNDYSYERVFVRQLETLSTPGDVAMGISTSGKSPNIISAIRTAKETGVVAVGMTGAHGDELAALADYCIRVPSDETARIQEAHMLIGHMLCEIIDEKFGHESDLS